MLTAPMPRWSLGGATRLRRTAPERAVLAFEGLDPLDPEALLEAFFTGFFALFAGRAAELFFSLNMRLPFFVEPLRRQANRRGAGLRPAKRTQHN